MMVMVMVMVIYVCRRGCLCDPIRQSKDLFQIHRGEPSISVIPASLFPQNPIYTMPTRRSSQILTQGKLNFGSTKPKRTTTQNVKPKHATILTGPKGKVESSNSEGSDIEGVEVTSSSEDESTPISCNKEGVEARKKASNTLKLARRTVKSPATSQQKVGIENKGAPKLNVNDSKYDAHYATVRQMMDYMPPSMCS